MDIILKIINRFLSVLQTHCGISNIGSDSTYIYIYVYFYFLQASKSYFKSVTNTEPHSVLAPSEVRV